MNTILGDHPTPMKSPQFVLGSNSVISMVVLGCSNALEMLSIKLYLVPGHRNISGNKSADESARCGSESIDMNVEYSIKFLLNDRETLVQQNQKVVLV